MVECTKTLQSEMSKFELSEWLYAPWACWGGVCEKTNMTQLQEMIHLKYAGTLFGFLVAKDLTSAPQISICVGALVGQVVEQNYVSKWDQLTAGIRSITRVRSKPTTVMLLFGPVSRKSLYCSAVINTGSKIIQLWVKINVYLIADSYNVDSAWARVIHRVKELITLASVFFSAQVKPWSRASGTAVAQFASARSSSRATRRRRKPKSTTPSSLQTYTGEKCCSCTPSWVSNQRLSIQFPACKCQEIPSSWKCKQFHVIIHFDLQNHVCHLHFHIILVHSHCSDNYSFHGEIIRCWGDGHQAVE